MIGLLYVFTRYTRYAAPKKRDSEFDWLIFLMGACVNVYGPAARSLTIGDRHKNVWGGSGARASFLLKILTFTDK